MQENHTQRNIYLYKVFVLFNEPLFWGPILITSLTELSHMTLPEIYFMESAIMIISVILNVPTGALADVIGRKKTLIIGRIFLLASSIMFAIMTSPLTAWIGNILWAVGYSFQSGADTAFFYNTLNVSGMEKQFTKLEGRAVGSRLILTAITSLFVGPLAIINMRIPLFLCVPFMIIPLIVSFYLKDSKSRKSYKAKYQIELIKDGFMYAIRKPEICWIIGLSALIMGASKIWFFTYNPYFEKVGLSLEYYGLIFFLLNIVAWIFSHYAYFIEKYVNESTCIIGIILCVGLPILLMGIFPFWPMAYLVISQNVVRGFMRPFMGNFMNRHIESENMRATVLSVRSSLSEMVSILSLSWFGLMDKSLGLLSSLVILGIIVLVLGAWSHARYRILFPAQARK